MDSITKIFRRKSTGDSVEAKTDIVALNLHGEEVGVNLAYVPNLVGVELDVHSGKKFLLV